MKTYNAQMVKDLIKAAIDEADQDMWNEIKGRPEERPALLAAADAFGYIEDAIYRKLAGL